NKSSMVPSRRAANAPTGTTSSASAKPSGRLSANANGESPSDLGAANPALFVAVRVTNSGAVVAVEHAVDVVRGDPAPRVVGRLAVTGNDDGGAIVAVEFAVSVPALGTGSIVGIALQYRRAAFPVQTSGGGFGRGLSSGRVFHDRPIVEVVDIDTAY